MSPDKPIILSKSLIAQTRLFNTEAVNLRFSNGQERTFERINSRHEAVLVVPQLDEDTLLLIREYAVGVENYQLGFPKGVIDVGETILVAANRELQEEIGYGAKALHLVQTVATSPGHMSSKMHIAYATELYPSLLPGDEPEPLEVVSLPISDIPSLINNPDFLDARSLSALLLFYAGFMH